MPTPAGCGMPPGHARAAVTRIIVSRPRERAASVPLHASARLQTRQLHTGVCAQKSSLPISTATSTGIEARWNQCHPTEGVDQYPSGTAERWVVTHRTQVPGDTCSSWVSRSFVPPSSPLPVPGYGCCSPKTMRLISGLEP